MEPKEYLKKNGIESVEIFGKKVIEYRTCLALMELYHLEMLRNVNNS